LLPPALTLLFLRLLRGGFFGRSGFGLFLLFSFFGFALHSIAGINRIIPIVVVKDFLIGRNIFRGEKRISFALAIDSIAAIFFVRRMIDQRAKAENQAASISPKAEPIVLDGGIARALPEFSRKVDRGAYFENFSFWNGLAAEQAPTPQFGFL
jgi:hypothetical protein